MNRERAGILLKLQGEDIMQGLDKNLAVPIGSACGQKEFVDLSSCQAFSTGHRITELHGSVKD